jgi:thiol-disulfide isomerase/thioredoxin
VGALILFVAAVVLALTVGRSGLKGVTLSSGSSGSAQVESSGPPAPEFTGIVGWDNSGPLTLAGLRGKVVLVDFWTYSCINCQRTFPFLRQWWDKYRADGFVIVGVHSPEFAFEHDPGNVLKATKQYGVTWPVALDSNMATWNAYNNQFWPAEYLIDKRGHIRHTHFGEGEYDVTERAIQQLLSEGGHSVTGALASADPGLGPDSSNESPETYAGSDRGNGSIKLVGAWSVQPEFAVHNAAGSTGHDYAEIAYQARRVFLVAGASGGQVKVRITLDGRDPTPDQVGSDVKFDASGAYVVVDRHDLFHLVALTSFGHHVLRISPDAAGFQLFTFTFGS